MRKDAHKPRKIRKWVWGGFAAVFVLLIGVGITVGILVANNKDSSSQLSAAESASNETDQLTPEIESNVTYAPIVALSNTSNTPIAVPVSAIPPSTLNNTTYTPSIVNSTDEVDDTEAKTSSPATSPASAVPATAPVVITTAPAPTTSSPTYLNEPTTTIFYAHGDVPYEAPQTVILEQQMKSVPLDAEFVIFVGDLRDAGDDKPCYAQEYEDASYYFRLSHAPVFVIQGDNDISDCPNMEEGRTLWMNEFVGFESKYWNHTFDIKRHDGYPDNFAFVHKLTLFIGLNIIGGDTRDVTEWETRLKAEAIWTTDLIRKYQMEYSMNSTFVGRVVIFGHANPGSRHATFFQAMSSFINYELMNSIPIVYINGDKHEWMYDENFYDNPSWLRVGVTGLGAEPLLRVTVEADGTYVAPAQAFELERFL
jgi:hypothetical protein